MSEILNQGREIYHPILSIVICTRDRLENLKEALESLEHQISTKNNVELLIIDNNSKDGTEQFIKEYCNKKNRHYFCEEKIGLANARNRGWLEAKGDFIGYTDDDAILPENWIDEALLIIAQKKYMIFGGPYYPFYKDMKPYWFKDDYGSSYWLPNKETELENNFLVGGNMFIHRKLLEESGGFPTQFGMSGNKLGYGEETYFQIKLLETNKNIKIFFSPRLYILHLVSKNKLSPFWGLKRYLIQGSNMFYHDYINSSNKKMKWITSFLISLLTIPIISFILVLDGTIGFIARNRKKYPFWQNYVYEKGKKYGVKIGYFLKPFSISPFLKC